MKFTYSPETRQAETFADIKEATAFLADTVLGPKRGETVSAEWTRVQTPREETLDRLTLRDEHGEVFADFKASELAIPMYIRASLYHLWFDLIGVELDQIRESRRRRLQAEATVEEGA